MFSHYLHIGCILYTYSLHWVNWCSQLQFYIWLHYLHAADACSQCSNQFVLFTCDCRGHTGLGKHLYSSIHALKSTILHGDHAANAYVQWMHKRNCNFRNLVETSLTLSVPRLPKNGDGCWTHFYSVGFKEKEQCWTHFLFWAELVMFTLGNSGNIRKWFDAGGL